MSDAASPSEPGPPFDPERFKPAPLTNRGHLVETDRFARAVPLEASNDEFLGSLPDFLGVRNLRALGAAVARSPRTLWGLGLSLNEFIGAVETRVFLTRTPVEEELVEVRMTFLPKRYEDEKLTRSLGAASMERVAKEFEGDIAIWENKAFVEKPLLCDGDGPLGRWRGWSEQFYPAGPS